MKTAQNYTTPRRTPTARPTEAAPGEMKLFAAGERMGQHWGIQCPACHATVGKGCTDSDGQRVFYDHSERIRAAVRAHLRCTFCRRKPQEIRSTDVALLSSFVSKDGAIAPRRRTGTCYDHQILLQRAIKQARQSGLLPHYTPPGRRRS